MNKILLGVIFIWILCFNALAQQDSVKLRIAHLKNDFYIYTTYKKFNNYPFPSNSMYLVTSKGVVLFDTPWDTTQFQPLLDSIERRHHKKVILCIATHYHDDRTAGLEFFNKKNITTYSSLQTYNLCAKHGEKQAKNFFKKDTLFQVANHKFQTYYPGEGHTEDNIVIWFPKEKIIYGGCLVKSTENSSLGNIADANLKAWPETTRNVIKKFPNPAYVIPGHFGWNSNKGLQHTLKLLEEYQNTH